MYNEKDPLGQIPHIKHANNQKEDETIVEKNRIKQK